MPHRIKRFEAACMARLKRRAPSGFVERTVFWLLPLFLILIAMAFLPGTVGDLSEVAAILAFPLLSVLLLILLWRWTFRRFLWTVRNRLILTCLLMGLAPVVLFATLTGVAAYLFAGQFATDVALLDINGRLERMHDQSGERAIAVERLLTAQQQAPAHSQRALPELKDGPAPVRRPDVHLATETTTWVDGRLLATAPGTVRSFLQAPLPVWLQPGFEGTVSVHGRLFLCALSGESAGGHTVLAMTTAPLDHDLLTELAQGLGNIFIYRAVEEDTSPGRPVRVTFENPNAPAAHPSGEAEGEQTGFGRVLQGGTLRPPLHFFDRKVGFFAPIKVSEWDTGKPLPEMIAVVSRPTLLYSLLFSNSVHIARLVSEGLIVITVIFTLLELIALLLAVRLGRTMTRSIAELYSATTQIDRGNLAHRIPVERKDQLGALATSFNTMAGSLAELLVQQREKERMQSELEIAQEVQNNLFPHTPVHMHRFELHGVCQPARTVSGDYYDFIVSGSGQLCFALGDISGKGISAALLMASLHSAVRAYHARHVEHQEPLACDALREEMPSPGKLLALLNRHLFLSTQPAKYATLFLACYDSATRKLTYSNGGHLTPFLLRADGRLDRLDCGGSVVGLLDNLEYPEATIELHAGDLLIAYSDGLTEPENEFEEFGEDRLVALIRKNRHEPLTTLTTQIMRALQQWIGTAEQPDDMTLVLARQL
jgi:sigma-B regulation protein RsbU (phosphoserine phosphatase)